MGSSERWKANDKALKRGAKAYRDGIHLDQCPYKYSQWGLGGWWDMGWREEQQKELEAKQEKNNETP
ncbi:MAG TPA: hypothetical protein ENI27_10655 [bacterium]|nr:hypothetical protein [bacterium]